MSTPDKHKPLSAEELFKLLENKSDKATDFEDMDDFEKEALEGFTNHSNPQKAKALSEELILEISKRVEQTGKGGTKNKFIWFSAAASIALIILVSIFFFNKSKQDLENNLALQEVTEDNKPSATAEQNAGLETVSKNKDNIIVEEGKEQETTKSQGVVNSKNAGKVTSSGLITEPSVAVSENKLSSLSGETGAKDESKRRSENDLDVLQKQAVVLTDKTDLKKKEKSNVEQEIISDVNATDQIVTAATSANEEADKLAYEADDSKKTKSIEQASKEKAAINKSSDNSVSYSKTTQAPSSVSTSDVNNSAYYAGGELTIKEFVLAYLKSKQTSKQIIGRYKIVGKVNVKGELSVSEIKQISKEDCNCTEVIKEALNTMNKWNPAIQNGKAIQSNVEFIVMF